MTTLATTPEAHAWPAPPWVWPRSAYVHIPFCAHRCGYCDFAVAAGQDHLIELYLDALAAELATLGRPQPVRTLFIGGGTPTYLSPPQLEQLFDALDRWLPRLADAEVSVESTPDSLDADKVAVLAGRGVNRLSVGAQSFDPATLSALDRRHTSDQVPRALELARAAIPAVSVDLIFGAPGQTLAGWRDDLRAAVALGTQHISTYGLTYETGTPLWKSVRRGRVAPLGEDDELAMYHASMDDLAAAGFGHYEISNFARPGYESRHNGVYWANEAHWGFGVGAARYAGGTRELNTRSLKEYMRKALAGEPAAFQREHLAPEHSARETLGQQMRRAAGIDRTQYREQTGFRLDELAGPQIERHAALGLLDDDGRRVALTRSGKCVADAVIAALL